ncbi:MAG: C45 family peptidase [Candidatus Liptonbacteria bacterium]|nr:C45 family peptidase [Candidatus Liptonbacteria bacterium]
MRAVLVSVILLPLFSLGCGMPKNKLNLHQRSMSIGNVTDEQKILGNASLEKVDPESNLRIVHLKGTPYEMGFQHGSLLKKEIQEFYGSVIFKIKFMIKEDMLDETYDLIDPYIPIEEKEEMRGLAHGAGVPLRVVHWVHTIPEISEYGPKKRFRRVFKETSCSNIAAFADATADGKMYHLRVLDWIRNLGAQRFPIVLVHVPDRGNSSATFSYAGFIGAISGMNDKQMTFGEMGYGDPPDESLEGIPFIFLFRKLMRESNSLDDATRIIKEAKRTCSYIYLITDAKGADNSKKAVLFITDRGRVKVSTENTDINDERDNDSYPGIPRVVYGGAKAKPLYDGLSKHRGAITPEILMEMTKGISLGSNMQNVVFAPETLEAWVSNASLASGDKGKACNQKWFHVRLKDALKP